jgi:hypothetical protein
MKRQFTGILVLLAGAFAVQAQGTVSLANYGQNTTYLYVGFSSYREPHFQLLGGSSTGPAPTLSNYRSLIGNGNDWTVQLYGAAGAGDSAYNLSPLPGGTATFANGGADPIPGTWFSSAIVGIPGTFGAGSVATVQLYAWYNDGGAITSFDQASADDVPCGFSSLGTVILGGPNQSGPPSLPALLPFNELGNFIVGIPSESPEPDTIVLGVLGASVFLLRLRARLGSQS